MAADRAAVSMERFIAAVEYRRSILDDETSGILHVHDRVIRIAEGYEPEFLYFGSGHKPKPRDVVGRSRLLQTEHICSMGVVVASDDDILKLQHTSPVDGECVGVVVGDGSYIISVSASNFQIARN
jgi:hypothetical protein